MAWLQILSLLLLIGNTSTLVSVGANLSSLRDWVRSLPWVNLVRQSRSWGSPTTPWDGNATFDPTTGWPTSDFGMVLVSDGVDLGGKYLLYAKGNASVTIENHANGYISEQNYDPSTNTLTAFINLEQGQQDFFLGFRNTSGPGLQDIAVLQPGYNLTAKSNITNLILTHLSRFSMIRFKDWTNTDDSVDSNWNDTTPVNWPRYTLPGHNPWETIPFLVNQLNQSVDTWVSLPCNSTDDYILHVAQIMFNDLNERNTIYVEWSNEVWNWGYTQAHKSCCGKRICSQRWESIPF